MKDYIIKKRNKDNSVFLVQKKLEGLPLLFRCLYKTVKMSEPEAIALINLGIKFFTYNKDGGSYTNVIKRGFHSNYHLASRSNHTKVDNIGMLPLI